MSARSKNDPRRKPGSRLSRATVVSRDEVRLTRKNWTLFAVALGMIVVGYIMLANRSITLAPILLVAGYCVVLPWAILAHDEPNSGRDVGSGSGRRP